MKNVSTNPLSKFLFPSKEEIKLNVKKDYKQVTIRMNHKGVIERDIKSGSEILSKQFIAKEGQFIISRIDARNGAMGIVPKELEGAIVTNDFLLFDVNKNEIDIEYLNFLSSTKSFDEKCKLASEGSTNRVRLKVDKFLNTYIPLPSLPTQKKIVKKLEAVKSRCDKAIQLRLLAEKEVEALRESFSKNLFDELAEMFGTIEVANSELKINPESINPSTRFNQNLFTYIDIGSVEQKTGRIIEAKSIKGINAPSRARRLMKINDIVMASVRPNLKKVFVVSSSLNQQICSTGFTILRGKEDYILPEFLRYQLISEYFIRQCKVTGGHYPAINDDNLRKVKLVIPPIEEQGKVVEEINAMTNKIQQIKAHQHSTNKELKALFPSVLDKAFKVEW